MTAGFALFDTAIGPCGIAWGERGVVGVQLPEASEARTRARLGRRFPEVREASPPPDVQRAIEGIVALLEGEQRDLADVALDMADVPAFERGVYEVARTIAPGATLTYGEIAARLGAQGDARAVGRGARAEPVPDRGAVPPRARGARPDRRLLRERRHRDQAPPAFDRTRPDQLRADALRESPVGRSASPPQVA